MARFAVVAGGARGIGEACVRRLVADGFSVLAADRLDADLARLAGELKAAGTPIATACVDLTRPADLERLAGQAREWCGAAGLAAAVNSVGVFDERRGLLETPLPAFQRMIDVNLTGAFLFSTALVPLLNANASLVHIGSVNGKLAGTDLGAYKIAKAGLNMMVRCLALELARDPRRIRVNCVAPGWVNTPGERALWESQGRLEKLTDPANLEYIPLKRFVESREIADTVGFLCGPGGTAVTGQVIYVDAGITA